MLKMVSGCRLWFRRPPRPRGRRGLLALGLLLLVTVSAGCGQRNLVENPSFEACVATADPAKSCPGWGGWVHEVPAHFALANFGHHSAHSRELVAESDGKIRLHSNRISLSPGRYQLRFYLRGLSIRPARHTPGLDFSVGYDDRFFPLTKAGSFGWTPVTYIFETKIPLNNFQIKIGLHGSGWLWVDDVALVRVASGIPLTANPVVGPEEEAIKPPGPLDGATVHCAECGFRNREGWSRCYACGHDLPPPGGTLPTRRVIADFGGGARGPVRGGVLVPQRRGTGFFLAAQSRVSIDGPQDWSGFDEFCLDVDNPAQSPVPLLVEVRDSQTRGYWSRVNFETMVPPGSSTVTIPTDRYVGEKSKPGRRLLAGAIRQLFIDPKGHLLHFNNLRLEKGDPAAVRFPGLHAFDFGPREAPVLEGFQKGTPAMRYEPGRGFGWEGEGDLRGVDSLQPDPLYQDYVALRSGSGTFRLDLPNGNYHVLANVDPPSGYWGEVPVYRWRQLRANGLLVADDRLDFSRFVSGYFRHADLEDLPGSDPFRKYVEEGTTLKEFDVTVKDGVLRLELRGDGSPLALCALVVYPQELAVRGRRFWNWAVARRHKHFDDAFRQVTPPRTGEAAPAEGVRLFSRRFMKPVHPLDGPLPGEEIPSAGLRLTVAGEEEGALSFSIQPSPRSGELAVELSDLEYTGPGSNRAPDLPASILNLGWLDYRITRSNEEGSVYALAPRYWHPLPAASAAEVTRTFWLRAKFPRGARPGIYRSIVTVRPGRGEPRSFPVTLELLPFQLDPISDVAVGPWGCSIPVPWFPGDPDKGAWDWELLEKSLHVLHEAGCTSFSGVPHLKVAWQRGSPVLDTARADREMALARDAGFSRLISSYGVDDAGYRRHGGDGGPDLQGMEHNGYRDPVAFLRTLYLAIDDHAVAQRWLPVAWDICDEPDGDAAKGALLNALAHREAAEGLRLTTFLGATSLKGEKGTQSMRARLVRALLVPALNGHDLNSLTLVREAGNRLAFYNDGNRWTYGRYLKMLVLKHHLELRLAWHYNNTAGDPYYALDCREEDFCWFNTNARRELVPSLLFLGEILPGLNDYRYLSTLKRLLDASPRHPAAVAARRVLDAQLDLEPGRDQDEPADPSRFDADRAVVTAAILSLLPPGTPSVKGAQGQHPGSGSRAGHLFTARAPVTD